jgi:transcriptional regulator with XRE-family HTH domain
MHPVIEKWNELHREYLYFDKPPYDFRTSDLAKYVGVSRRTIERWAEGKSLPKEEKIRAIEEFIKLRGA